MWGLGSHRHLCPLRRGCGDSIAIGIDNGPLSRAVVNADGRTRTADLRVMKGEESAVLQGVAEEEQRGRQQEVLESVEQWIRSCPVKISLQQIDAVRFLVGSLHG
jgi:hypothetical protein